MIMPNFRFSLAVATLLIAFATGQIGISMQYFEYSYLRMVIFRSRCCRVIFYYYTYKQLLNKVEEIS